MKLVKQKQSKASEDLDATSFGEPQMKNDMI